MGGTAKRWRVDRMATVIKPGTSQVQRSFVPVAKHYGVGVDPCPPRHGNRKGVVEKNIHYLTQRWWRSARVVSPAEAPAEPGPVPLLALPDAPFPAEVIVVRTVAANALVSLWGNRYSVPPVSSAATSRSAGASAPRRSSCRAAGAVVATHTLAPRGAQRTVRLPEHTQALENVVFGAFNTDRPCRRKVNRPPSDAALVLAAELLGDRGADPVIDLDIYRRAIDGQDVG